MSNVLAAGVPRDGIERQRRVLLYALLAGAVASAIAWLGPPGTDLAAHVYQRDLFLHDGFLLWNNFWYAGRYTFVTYSLIYYPLAAGIGIHLLGVLSATIAAAAFGLLVEREFGRAGRWAAWTFAAVTGISLLGAAFPYQLGLACALAALLAIQRRRLGWFAVLVVLTFAASPLAFALLVVVLGAVALARSGTDIGKPAAVVVVTAVFGLALWRVFPGRGWFPFSALGLGAVLAFCATGFALTWRVVDARVLRYVFATYGAACVVFYVIPSGIGENIVRLRFLALPLAVLTLSLRSWRPRPLAVGVLALAVMWNLTPIASSFERGVEDPSANAAYWQPAVAFLRKNLTPSYRVEAVDTSGHWDAVYLPRAGIPIVRGWFRQDDFPQNAVLYGQLSSHAYLRWLRSLGVRYVVLTAAPADYSARREAALLRSHHSGLRPVFRAAHVTIFAVPNVEAIIRGPGDARVLSLTTGSIRLRVARAGAYRLAVRYSPYWVSRGACVSRRRDGMVGLVVRRPGTIDLRFVLSAGATLSALAGEASDCPT